MAYLNEIYFSEVFSHMRHYKNDVILPNDFFNSILYTDILEKTKDLEESSFSKNSYKKIVLRKQTGIGIIIGQTRRFEGISVKSMKGNSYTEGEQGYLKIKKSYSFWVVSIGMNETVLVPKYKTQTTTLN